MEATRNLTLPEAMHDAMARYEAVVRDLAGDNALSLTVFGGVLEDSFLSSKQSARSVLVVRRIDLGMLRQLSDQGVHLGKDRIAAPLIMTPEYVKDSCDTFPLELIEIQQRHLTLFGDDPFAGLTFEAQHVQLQCERELKVILIGLRQGLLASAGRERFLSALEMDIGAGLLRTVRGMLWLKGKQNWLPADAALTEMEALADRKLPGARAAMDPDAAHGWSEFQQLYADVEAMGELANAW